MAKQTESTEKKEKERTLEEAFLRLDEIIQKLEKKDTTLEDSFLGYQEGNGVYIFVLEGEITVAEERLSKRDGIGVWDTKEFPIHILKGTQLLLIEVPM